MGISLGSKRGVVSDPNIVPLIDILLVLLVMFMLIPHSLGLRAQIPQECVARDGNRCSGGDKPGVVVIQVLADGSFQVNQEPVKWENLESRLTRLLRCVPTAPRSFGAMRPWNSLRWQGSSMSCTPQELPLSAC